ncbi:MAG: ribosomal-processing cysteine protease Prp [Clostridiales bacterium]|jgi:uncharacterized protein YsxB (DUF464 family)|nr:ribosomal-processing cysteine protease Prp [Clostridiales bacterium]HOA34299.1 ribosomal-processing cysteine protease Prp [Clostridiales bacterium]HOJ36055.1 ribosomal-processing cysteine protease Prp [Clostridiales bacterium]HOL79928.1 ribosomal-processing cysteine protease Prp [Clostridiales bacterium]HPP68265.1 ribosomal-processing cysteine protease Prp [Clostridiales bacterium]
MIKAVFTLKEDYVTGFSIKGHALYAEHGQDIVCAAVSSAAYMAANTVTEVFGAEADIKVDEGFFELKLKNPEKESCNVLKGLMLHINGLKEQYPTYIETTTEVLSC